MSLATVEMNESAIHVLAVDDSAADRNLIRLSLSDSSYCYKLECAARLSEGLSKLEQQRADVVLLDLNLPDSQGGETIKKVIRHAPHVPVLILTGSDDDCMALQAVRSGAQDYIVKGQITNVALSRAMRYAIERHGVLRASRQVLHRQSESMETGIQKSPETSSPSPCLLKDAGVTLRGSTGSLAVKERFPELGRYVMKSRQGYEGFIIEARVHARTEGGFSVEISVEDHDRCGVREKKFYIPNTFDAPESAMEIAIQTGRQRIDEGLWGGR